MRSNRIQSFVSVVVLGIAVLLSTVCAQTPMPDPAFPSGTDTYEEFIAVLNQHEQRMEELQAEFEATLPHVGPWTDYQLKLLAQLEFGERPMRLEASIHQCLQGGNPGSVSLTTLLDSSSIVLHRDRDLRHFYAKPGFKFIRPTATNAPGVIDFDGDTGNNGRHATADFEDAYAEGQVAPPGHAGSGRYKISCSGPNGSYSQSWSWRLFRDLFTP